MSKDPLEELFGPLPDEPEPEPKPVPARERLSFEQAERVRTAKIDTPKQGRGSGAKPWIIVGIVAVVAIVLSLVVVNLARGGGDDPAPTNTAAPTTTKSPTTTPEETTTPTETKTPETPDADQVPKVDVGPTSRLDIQTWGVTSQLSQKFGLTSYAIPDNVHLTLDSPLINSLPDSCKEMRTQWGVTRAEDGSYKVAKPAERCEAAPELFDELWGLTDAFLKSFKPL